MKCIIYYYSNTSIITLDYDDGYTQTKIRYIGYTLRQAIKKFRQEYNLTHKHIKIIKLY